MKGTPSKVRNFMTFHMASSRNQVYLLKWQLGKHDAQKKGRFRTFHPIHGHFSGKDDSYDDKPMLNPVIWRFSTDFQVPKCTKPSLQEMEHVWVDDPSLSVRAGEPQFFLMGMCQPLEKVVMLVDNF
jgi:hypothetical protein